MAIPFPDLIFFRGFSECGDTGSHKFGISKRCNDTGVPIKLGGGYTGFLKVSKFSRVKKVQIRKEGLDMYIFGLPKKIVYEF